MFILILSVSQVILCDPDMPWLGYVLDSQHVTLFNFYLSYFTDFIQVLLGMYTRHQEIARSPEGEELGGSDQRWCSVCGVLVFALSVLYLSVLVFLLYHISTEGEYVVVHV